MPSSNFTQTQKLQIGDAYKYSVEIAANMWAMKTTQGPRLFRLYRNIPPQLCGECTMYLLDHPCMQTICLRFELSWWACIGGNQNEDRQPKMKDMYDYLKNIAAA